MNEEMYDLYKSDKDFHEFVDRWCKSSHEGIFEVLEKKIAHEYAKVCIEREKERRAAE